MRLPEVANGAKPIFRGVLLLVLAILPGLAQEQRPTLRITVQSGDSPVAGANLTINGVKANSDRAGIAIVPVTPGKVEISVTKEGFLPGKTSIVIDEAREWQVVLELQRQEAVEETITVHATRTDTRIQDSPTRVEVLTTEEIEEKTMMTPGDIVMMLNEMGGLRVQTTSPSLGAASVRIQGMLGRYTRFLSDGLPLFGQQGGGLGLLQIPPMDLGQVEVIKGVASALYGTGALAGVVNLVSRRPGKEPVREVLVNRSTRGATDAALFLAAPLSANWSASFLGGGHFQTRNDIDGDGWADLAGYARGVLRPRFFWDGGDGRTALITAGFTYEDREGGTIPGAVLQATGAPYREALGTRRSDVGGTYQFLLDTRYVVTARAAFSIQEHDHRFGETRERDRHELLFGEWTIRGTAGRNTWVAGLAAEYERFTPRDVPRFGYEYTTPGFFLQDDVTVAPWLSVSASARVDINNRFGAFLSPRLSGLARWGGWTSRVSAGLGFVAPTPLTEETEASGLARLAIPQRLVPERGRNVSVDLTRAFGQLSATATLFASRVSHPVRVERDTGYRLVNLPDPATNIGIDTLVTWRKAPFSATASYTYVNSREPEFNQRVATPLTPRQSFGLVGMWERHDTWRVGAECYYTGTQRLEANPYRSESRAYVLFGLLIERSVGRARLFVNAENLANVRQTRWDPLLLPARGVDGRWTVDAWAPLDGRVVNGGVRVRF